MSSKKIPYTELSLGERLKFYRKSNGLNLKQFSDNIGISNGTLSDLENNKSKPSSDTYVSLIRNTDINLNWLLTGEGQMIVQDEDKSATMNKKAPNTFTPDPEIDKLLNKALKVITSQTRYAESLKASIDSFFELVEANEKIDALQSEVGTMRSQINELQSYMKNDRRTGDRRSPSNKKRVPEGSKERRSGKDRRESGLGK